MGATASRAARSPSSPPTRRRRIWPSASSISVSRIAQPGCSCPRTKTANGLAPSRKPDVAALQPQLRGGGAAVLGRLVDDAEQRTRPGQRLAEALLVALEGVEAAAQHERQLVLQHAAGGAQLALIAVTLAQQARLAVGAAVAELGGIEHDQLQPA